jgi:hypothetical protein
MLNFFSTAYYNKGILMNIRLISQLGLLVCASTVFSLEAMYFAPLSAIEKMLVQREIQRRGVEAVRQEIYNAGDPEKISKWRHYVVRVPTVLRIDMIFKKEDIQADSLAKNIFEEIQKIESASGYIPKSIITEDQYAVTVISPTNFIGSNTRYYWLEENSARIPAVRVKAKLTNKSELKDIVDAHN